MITDFDEFELAVKRATPISGRIDGDSWFHIEVNSVYKAKSIKVLFFKRNHTFIEHGETMTEVYNKMILSINNYYEEFSDD